MCRDYVMQRECSDIPSSECKVMAGRREDRNAGVTQSLFKMDSPQSGDRAFSERAESLIGMGNNNDATGIHRIEHGINAANRVWKVGRFAGYDHSGHDLEVDHRAEGFNYASAHELRENGMVMSAIGCELGSLPCYSPSQLGQMIHDTLQQQQQQAHAQTEPQPAAQDPMAALVAEANIDLSAQGVQGDSQNYGVPYAPDYVPGVQPNNRHHQRRVICPPDSTTCRSSHGHSTKKATNTVHPIANPP